MAGDHAAGPPAAVTVERVRRQTRPAFSPSGSELASGPVARAPARRSGRWIRRAARPRRSRAATSSILSFMQEHPGSPPAVNWSSAYVVHRLFVSRRSISNRGGKRRCSRVAAGGTDEDEDEALLNAADLSSHRTVLSVCYFAGSSRRRDVRAFTCGGSPSGRRMPSRAATGPSDFPCGRRMAPRWRSS